MKSLSDDVFVIVSDCRWSVWDPPSLLLVPSGIIRDGCMSVMSVERGEMIDVTVGNEPMLGEREAIVEVDMVWERMLGT